MARGRFISLEGGEGAGKSTQLEALGMGMGSRALARRITAEPQQQAFFGALNAMSGGRVVPAAGGVLVKDAQGVVVGAVGISGDASDKDEACALAGIAAAALVGDTG